MSVPQPRGPRLRELGLAVGRGVPGPGNAITDVPGVGVGHVTIWRDEPEPPEGRGTGRSGVTVVVPREPGRLVHDPVPAGAAVLNGAGELTSFNVIREWGVAQTPIYLTATMAVGRVYDGAVTAAVAADSSVGVEEFVIPVVAECDDGWLSEARVVQVEAGDAARALEAVSFGSLAEGAVGAGTGMIAFGYKAGIGTASRMVPELNATLGVIVLANFGIRRDLVVDGVPVGEILGGAGAREQPAGSCIAVVATDAPLGTHELTRVARRCGLGLARVGSVAYDGSGEIFLAVGTGGSGASLGHAGLDDLFLAAVESTEEAVLNALWAAPEVTGRDGRVAPALPHDAVLALLEERGRLG